jgi:hypothetical protein
MSASLTPQRVDSANELLLRSHETHQRGAVTRAWLIPGRAQTWQREVLDWKARMRFPTDAEDWAWFVGKRER